MRKILLLIIILLVATGCGTAVSAEDEGTQYQADFCEPADVILPDMESEPSDTIVTEPAAGHNDMDNTLSEENHQLMRAARYFAAVNELFDEDSGLLWGFKLHVPIMFVDTETREVIANRPDPSGRMTRQGAVYVGVLPDYLDFDFMTYEYFGGELWIIMPWQMSWFWHNERGFRRTISHKAIHWHQLNRTFGYLAPWCIDHMNDPEARISIQLEINALMQAFNTADEERRLSAINDALSIRAERRRIFDRGTDENRQEIMEGLAQYTEWILTSRTRSSILENMRNWARDMVGEGREREFFYLSGALYAFLLNETGVTWKPGLTLAYSDLGQLLKEALGITELRDFNEIDLTKYGYNRIVQAEMG